MINPVKRYIIIGIALFLQKSVYQPMCDDIADTF